MLLRKPLIHPTLVIALLMFLAASCLLVIKGATNAISFALSLFCLWRLFVERGQWSCKNLDHTVGFVLCLMAPICTELFAQLGQGQLRSAAFDGPSRFLLFIPVFLYLVTHTNSLPRVLTFFAFGSAVGIIMVVVSLILFPEFYWEDRAATYFVDPITLPTYTVVLFGIFVFVDPFFNRRRVRFTLNVFLFVCVGFVCLESASRTSWLAMIGLCIAWAVFKLHLGFFNLIVLFGLAGLGLIGLYSFNSNVAIRWDDAYSVVYLFLSGDAKSFAHIVQGSGVGHRIISFFVDIYLIRENLWFGVWDSELPPYHQILSAVPLLTPEIFEIKRLAGSHSEYLAQLVQKGLILGSLHLVALYLYPLYLVFRYRKHGASGADPNIFGILGVVIPLTIASLTIQVFNLKMTSSFYGLCLTIFVAAVLSRASVVAKK